MKRLLVFALLIVACKKDSPPPIADPGVAPTAGSAVATNDPWSAKAEPVESLKRPFLWSIEKDGKTTYAMGTMHIGIDPERLPKFVWDKVTSTPAFAMETDATDASLINLGARTSGSLREDLGPDYYARLEKLIDPQILAALNTKKPVLAAVMLSMRGIPMTGMGMDTSLMAKAKAAGKPILTLETAAKQAQLLERWMDVKALKLMIDTADQSLEKMQQMMAAYIAGDEAKMAALNEGMRADAVKHGYTDAEYDQQMAEMLWDRNASWIPAIESMHAKGGGFVAVGALHLIGKKSVLEMLEAKGYKISRVEK